MRARVHRDSDVGLRVLEFKLRTTSADEPVHHVYGDYVRHEHERGHPGHNRDDASVRSIGLEFGR